MAKELTVLQAKVGEDLQVVKIDDSLESLQALVGGYIETIWLSDDVILVVNEEGKLQNLSTNFVVLAGSGVGVEILDTIVGDAFFVSRAGEDFVSLDKMQIKAIKDNFINRSTFIARY